MSICIPLEIKFQFPRELNFIFNSPGNGTSFLFHLVLNLVCRKMSNNVKNVTKCQFVKIVKKSQKSYLSVCLQI